MIWCACFFCLQSCGLYLQYPFFHSSSNYLAYGVICISCFLCVVIPQRGNFEVNGMKIPGEWLCMDHEEHGRIWRRRVWRLRFGSQEAWVLQAGIPWLRHLYACDSPGYKLVIIWIALLRRLWFSIHRIKECELLSISVVAEKGQTSSYDGNTIIGHIKWSSCVIRLYDMIKYHPNYNGTDGSWGTLLSTRRCGDQTGEKCLCGSSQSSVLAVEW